MDGRDHPTQTSTPASSLPDLLMHSKEEIHEYCYPFRPCPP